MSAQVPFGPVGIIDIGSNSVRLVVYGGTERVPSILYNEKVMAGLGRTIGADGNMDDEAMDMALGALARFRKVTRRIGTRRLRTVATAAVRDAKNGADFLAECSKLGIRPALISGEEEAVGAAYGVLSSFPRAGGIVADLGGGSLELAGVARGAVGNVVSLPLGVLRVGEEPDVEHIAATLDAALDNSLLRDAARGKKLYLVGGSFRSVAMLEMMLSGHPLPIVHAHKLDPEQLDALADYVDRARKKDIKQFGRISTDRIPHMPAAIAILKQLTEKLGPKRALVSSYGLREGLLYADLPEKKREEDPLLAAALEVGRRLGRFGDHGALLDQYISPLFVGEGAKTQRLRLCACLLGDIAWNAHPDFRAERAVDLATHGNWVGINAHGRAKIGLALYTAFGGDGGYDEKLASLLSLKDISRAQAWGKAIRFAQRLSAGTANILKKTQLDLKDGTVILTLPEKERTLYSDAVMKRFDQLGQAMGKDLAVRFS